jgi:tRNA 2-thiouridine synthesizing protein A
VTRIDIRGFACPMTWVKTRIALGRLQVGEALEVLLSEGEPLENLPRSAVEDGHRVVLAEPAPAEGTGVWRLLLEKGMAPPEGF